MGPRALDVGLRRRRRVDRSGHARVVHPPRVHHRHARRGPGLGDAILHLGAHPFSCGRDLRRAPAPRPPRRQDRVARPHHRRHLHHLGRRHGRRRHHGPLRLLRALRLGHDALLAPSRRGPRLQRPRRRLRAHVVLHAQKAPQNEVRPGRPPRTRLRPRPPRVFGLRRRAGAVPRVACVGDPQVRAGLHQVRRLPRHRLHAALGHRPLRGSLAFQQLPQLPVGLHLGGRLL
mmetsp:Transcript_22539/g.89493  ORF Transcript_22539/g.89493 Transcript_22539/m.89493 type:complete len:231 (-) Transcript_22539:866-1558(-)